MDVLQLAACFDLTFLNICMRDAEITATIDLMCILPIRSAGFKGKYSALMEPQD